ncbi:MAG: transporter substrate-binding domain-containing protein [Erysipelotrichaceae bacterium]|nr:transporter substrate-binding domain-containing protein [Erysipelotrichaceae bacterium]
MKNGKLFKAAMASLLALSLTACGGSNADGGSSAEGGEKAQNIIIAISPDYPPFDDLTTDGQLTGFDVEMGEWIFTWLNENGYNFTHEWKQLSFDTIISAIQADQVDLGLSGFTYDPDRKVLFSDPYYGSAEVAMVNAGSAIASLDDLAGKTIGAQAGTTGEECANEIEGAKVTAMQDMGILVETLKTGGLDALILDEPVAKNYAAGGQFTVLEGALIDEETHIIAKEGNTELMDAINKALAAFLESDECAALKEKYGL